MKTTLPRQSEIERKWVLIDADGQPLGRMAVRIANLLRGRGKPIFTPHLDTGDFVVVINAEKVKLTGRKEEQKIYQRFTGYRGGLREVNAAFMRERHPERIIELAVKGMLPGNKLSRQIIKRLKIHVGNEHPHEAQAPEAIG
tara:strand:+ start:1982 stop:2407 length:426 start_codon:yes stop_codon:yes gene_type:complete